MNEKLFQHIWQHKYFNLNDLKTTEGQNIIINNPGKPNINEGPDFLNGKITIAGTIWVGNIELHLKTSDWLKHGHNADANYNNVVLHVVYENDASLPRNIPTLELGNRISKMLLDQYARLLNSTEKIACSAHILNTDKLVFNAWLERMLIERLEDKTKNIKLLLSKNNYHWEEVFWWKIAANFGAKINSEAFEKIAASIPIKIINKHKSNLNDIEALLFGQAGLLNRKLKDPYCKMLKKEFAFLTKKYSLNKIHYPIYFLRMRPANFPTVRLAQLAALINKSSHLFSTLKEEPHLKNVKNYLTVEATNYWQNHYNFDVETISKPKTIGEQMIDNIIINTVIPVFFTYSEINSIQSMKEKMLRWLSEIQPENNYVTRVFEDCGIEIKSAFESQALLHLKKEYCDQKKCLQCSVGNKIIYSSCK